MTEVAVRGEQVRSLYRRGIAAFVTNVVNAAIVAGLLWEEAPHSVLCGWLGLVASIAAGRYWLHRFYWRSPFDPAAAARWGRRFAAGSAFSGACWGLSGYILFGRGGAVAQLVLPLAVGGMTAAAAGTLSAYFPAFIAFVLPALFGIAARAVIIGDVPHLAMGSMFVIYGLALWFVAGVNHGALRDALRFRFRNEALLEELSAAQARLEETNRTLEQRVAERSEALQRQGDALREAQRMESIGRLAGGVAHDFNNLLMVVLGNASDLIDDPRVGDAAHGRLAEVRDAAARGAELVKQLLLFGRRQSTRRETLDLNQVVTTTERLLRRLIGEHLTLTVSVHPSPLFIRVDPSQIEQVVINLVTNARDAMSNGGIVSIETALLAEGRAEDGLDGGQYAVLTVSDTGSGMDSQTRLRVFEPFFTTKGVGQGTGLGLATVYAVVDQSGGKVRVESELQHGSRFRVYLPIASAPSLHEVPSGVTVASEWRSATVLLVEDDASVRAVAARMLGRGGYQVLIACNAAQAIAIAAEQAGPIHVLVTDVVMPGLSGPELGTRLRLTRPGLCILFMSGYRREHVIPGADETEGVAFIAKPFAHGEFMARIADLVGHSTASKKSSAPAKA